MTDAQTGPHSFSDTVLTRNLWLVPTVRSSQTGFGVMKEVCGDEFTYLALYQSSSYIPWFEWSHKVCSLNPVT